MLFRSVGFQAFAKSNLSSPRAAYYQLLHTIYGYDTKLFVNAQLEGRRHVQASNGNDAIGVPRDAVGREASRRQKSPDEIMLAGTFVYELSCCALLISTHMRMNAPAPCKSFSLVGRAI